MKTGSKRPNTLHNIKFEILPEQLTAPDIYEEMRWENDGGQSPELIHMIDDSDLPIHPGATFRVHKGEVIREGEKYFYLAEIELLPNDDQ
jgi:hypothetical protein